MIGGFLQFPADLHLPYHNSSKLNWRGPFDLEVFDAAFTEFDTLTTGVCTLIFG